MQLQMFQIQHFQCIQTQELGKIVQKDWTVNSDNSVSAPVETAATYDQNREREYPQIGDVIDALFKKEAGDSSEWNALVTSRANTKTKYPKSQLTQLDTYIMINLFLYYG